MGMVGAAFGLGFIFGPAIGGLLSRIRPETPMWFAVGAVPRQLRRRVVPAARIAAGQRDDQERSAAWRRSGTRMSKPTLLLLLVAVLHRDDGVLGLRGDVRAVQRGAVRLHAASIGFLFAFIGVVLALVQGVLVGRVVKRIGERRLIPLAIFAIAIGIGMLPFVWNVPTLLGRAGVLAVGMGFNSPSLSSMVSQLSDPDDQGGILGLASSLASLGRVVGPAWGGYLYDAYGMTTPYLSAAAL